MPTAIPASMLDDADIPDETDEPHAVRGKSGRKPKDHPFPTKEKAAAKAAAELPAWMKDKSLLPRKPPGRS